MELSHIESRLCQPAQSAHTHKSATQCFHYAVPKAGSVVTQDNHCFVGRFLPSDQPQPRTSHLFIPEFAICLVGMWGMWPFFIVTNTVLCWMRKCMARDSFSLRCSILLLKWLSLGNARLQAHGTYKLLSVKNVWSGAVFPVWNHNIQIPLSSRFVFHLMSF